MFLIYQVKHSKENNTKFSSKLLFICFGLWLFVCLWVYLLYMYVCMYVCVRVYAECIFGTSRSGPFVLVELVRFGLMNQNISYLSSFLIFNNKNHKKKNTIRKNYHYYLFCYFVIVFVIYILSWQINCCFKSIFINMLLPKLSF